MLNNIPNGILVGTGGFFGAISRYYIGAIFQDFKPLPYGTLVVNVMGSFLLGLLVMMFRIGVVSSPWITFGGIGFLGSYTTMSSFAVETLTLNETSTTLAIINLVIMILFVIVGAFIGRTVAIVYYQGV